MIKLKNMIIKEEVERSRNYLLSRGLPGDFIDKTFDAASDNIWYPTHEELADNGVITHIYDGEQVFEANAIRTHVTSKITSQAQLEQFADNTNKKLPIMIDKDTKLNNVVALGNEIMYEYILVNQSLENLDASKFIENI